MSGTPTGDIFTPGSAAAGSYTYDANGNMLTDSRKSLQFTYNFLNLLSEVKSGSTVKAKYTWLADGSKLRVRNNSTTGFDYLGSLTYTSSSSGLTLETAQFAGGVIRSGNSQEINYFITDHLGSVRSIVNSAGTAVEQNDYYAFGAKHVRSTYPQSTNRLDYNGKEEQTTGNLKYLDYGARMYDNTIGRWFNQDPLAEKYYAFSTFAYTANNPLNAIDPNGKLIVFVSGFDPLLFASRIFPAHGPSARPGLRIERLTVDRSITQEPNKMYDLLGEVYSKAFGDNNLWYVNGYHDWPSDASDRYENGYNSGLELITRLSSGEIVLAENETIKLVGYSMGAAFAAGMAKAISKNEKYRGLLEFVDYIAPYKPGDFSHPDGIFGRQFGSINDYFSDKGKILIENVDILTTGDFGSFWNIGGHIGGDLTNWLSRVISAGIPVYIVE